jgi:Gnt-I system high-affinity gluconate transporter
MLVFIIVFVIVLLISLISWLKFNPFIAFIIVSVLAGLMLGMPLHKIPSSIQKGIGDSIGSLLMVILCGAMIGKLFAESGAAQRISLVMLNFFGKKYITWALMFTGFFLGIPLFYNVGFVLLVPLIFSIVYQVKLPALYVAIPMLAALSVTHGFLPPHPSPTALVSQLNADMGLTLMYGIVVAIPAIVLAGPVFATQLKNIPCTPLATFIPKKIDESQLPGFLISVLTALLPVFILIVTTFLPLVSPIPAGISGVFSFLSDPSMLMFSCLLFATFSLGLSRGTSLAKIMNTYADSLKDMMMIILIVAGAGTLKNIFTDSGMSGNLAEMLKGINLSPLFLGWLIAAVIRVAMGSATVAGLTTAGIIAPLVLASGTDPNLMVLSVGAGSLFFSHVNDSGFWLFKEYFNLSIKDTMRSWSIMETIVSVVGLLGVLLLNYIIH